MFLSENTLVCWKLLPLPNDNIQNTVYTVHTAKWENVVKFLRWSYKTLEQLFNFLSINNLLIISEIWCIEKELYYRSFF